MAEEFIDYDTFYEKFSKCIKNDSKVLKFSDKCVLTYVKTNLCNSSEETNEILLKLNTALKKVVFEKDLKHIKTLIPELEKCDRKYFCGLVSCFIVDATAEMLFLLPEEARYINENSTYLIEEGKKEMKKKKLIRQDTLLARAIKKYLLGWDTVYLTSNYKIITTERGAR